MMPETTTPTTRRTAFVLGVAAATIATGLLTFRLFGSPIIPKNYCPESEKFVCPGNAPNPEANWLAWGLIALGALVILAYIWLWPDVEDG